MCHDLFCLSLFGGDQLPMELLLPKSIRDRHESLFDGDYTPIFSFQFPTILAPRRVTDFIILKTGRFFPVKFNPSTSLNKWWNRQTFRNQTKKELTVGANMNSKKVIQRVSSIMELGCPMMELGFIIWLLMVFWCFSHQDSGGYEVLIAPRWLVRHLFCVFFSWTFCLIHFGGRVKHRSFHGISILPFYLLLPHIWTSMSWQSVFWEPKLNGEDMWI